MKLETIAQHDEIREKGQKRTLIGLGLLTSSLLTGAYMVYKMATKQTPSPELPIVAIAALTQFTIGTILFYTGCKIGDKTEHTPPLGKPQYDYYKKDTIEDRI